jgi:transcriptional regulator with XRE-family HTH domain
MANTPSDLVARRVRDLRNGRGWTVKQLAARCAEAGVRLSEQALYKLEAQRDKPDRTARAVTVDEMLGLAYVLEVAPVYLLTGTEDDAGDLPVTPEVAVPQVDARRWIRGFAFLPGTDVRKWRSNRPASEASTEWRAINAETDDLHAMLAGLDETRAQIMHILHNRETLERERQEEGY